MADEKNLGSVVKIGGEIKLGSDVFGNAPVLTAVGAAVKEAQQKIAESGGDATKDFKFSVVYEAEKPPRQARQPRTPAAPATPPAAGQPSGQQPPAAGATQQPAGGNK